jgi:hypothetical protein
LTAGFAIIVKDKTETEREKMRLGIFGVIALALGVWALVYCWWFVVEIVQGLVALGLVIGGALAIAIAVRRTYRVKQSSEQ